MLGKKSRGEIMYKRSEKGFFGTYVHRDENNNIIGTSEPNPLLRKEMIHKDSSGKITGRSSPDFCGGFVHYDENNNVTGRSAKSPFGYVNYDANGNVIGRSDEAFFGTLIHKDINK